MLLLATEIFAERQGWSLNRRSCKPEQRSFFANCASSPRTTPSKSTDATAPGTINPYLFSLAEKTNGTCSLTARGTHPSSMATRNGLDLCRHAAVTAPSSKSTGPDWSSSRQTFPLNIHSIAEAAAHRPLQRLGSRVPIGRRHCRGLRICEGGSPRHARALAILPTSKERGVSFLHGLWRQGAR